MKKTAKTIMLVCLIMLIPCVTAYAGDYDSHWAKDTIELWVKEGYVKGDETGSINPDKEITRAEFAAMVNRVAGVSSMSEIAFGDVDKDKWYFDEVKKAIAAGYMTGKSADIFAPEEKVTRQEVAVVIAKLMYLYPESKNIKIYTDEADISQWAVEAMASVIEKKVMTGYPDSTLRPASYVTKAEAIVMLDKGTKSDLVITEDGTILRDRKLRGNILIAEIVGEGEVTFDNIETENEVIIEGGGENSVIFRDARVHLIIAGKKNGKLRIVAEGNSQISNVHIRHGVKIEQGDNRERPFGKIEIDKDFDREQNIELNCRFREVHNRCDDMEIKSLGKVIKLLKDKKYIDKDDLDEIFAWLEKDFDDEDFDDLIDDWFDDDDRHQKPGKPDKPGDDDKPDKPDKPGDDDKPDKPDKPGDDDKPDKPDKPGDDDKPDKPDKPGDDDIDFVKGYPYVRTNAEGYYEVVVKVDENADIYVVQGINDDDDSGKEDILHGHRGDDLCSYYNWMEVKKDQEAVITTDWMTIQNKMPEMGFYVLAINKHDIEDKDIEFTAEDRYHPDVTPPEPLKAYLSNDGMRVTILFNESIDKESIISKESFRGIDVTKAQVKTTYDEHGHLNASGVILTLSTPISDGTEIIYEKPIQGGIQDIAKVRNKSEDFSIVGEKTSPKIEKAKSKGNNEIYVTISENVNAFATYGQLNSNTFRLFDNDKRPVKITSVTPIGYNIFRGYNQYKVTYAKTEAENLQIEYMQGIETNAGDTMGTSTKSIFIDKTAPKQQKMEIRGNTLVLTFDEALWEKNILPCSFEVKINDLGVMPAKTRIMVEGNKIKITIEGTEIKETDKVKVSYKPKHKTQDSYITDESRTRQYHLP